MFKCSDTTEDIVDTTQCIGHVANLI